MHGLRIVSKRRKQRTAEWKYDRPGHWFCSSCGYMEGRIALSGYRRYCPVCGAKMDEVLHGTYDRDSEKVPDDLGSGEHPAL